MRLVTLIEIDLPLCSLTYATAPCQAALGVTGEKKCFNTRRTCQDIENFDPVDTTLRFAEPTADHAYDALPNLSSVRTTPGVIDPGRSLGQRESVTATFTDHPHSDAGPILFDKYLADRAYVPFDQGTFWGKFRARHTSLKGAALRVKRGEYGTDPADLETWHYVIESMDGPSGAKFTITAKDALKLADGDRAQAPAVSGGFLAAPIDGDTATLAPAGVGDSEYPASGKVAIGGKEICAFTRVGDELTLTRGQSNTEIEEHEGDERVQLVLEYSAESAADIIYDLLTTYSRVREMWIPLATWQTEVAQFIGRLYSAEIAQPTSVRELVDELIEQVGLAVWTDVRAQQIRLTALRPVSESADVYDVDTILQGSYRVKEQPKKRISQAWTFYGLINPLEQIDEPKNYLFAAARVDPDGTEADYDDQPAIHEVFSRWIQAGNRPAAERLNALLLARYSTPPRRFSWAVWATANEPLQGRGYRISDFELQLDTGEITSAAAQVTSVARTADRFEATAEEMLFTGDIGDKTVVYDEDRFNINLRDDYDQFYIEPQPYETITFVIEENVSIGSQQGPQSAFTPTLHPEGELAALNVGDWPATVQVRLIVNGRIQGVGAAGGGVGVWPDPDLDADNGSYGGKAITTRSPIMIENHGEIWGGGGGGGKGTGDTSTFEFNENKGGGGAGYDNRYDGSAAYGGPPSPSTGRGTQEAGGASLGDGGTGGDPGQAGSDGPDGMGGDPGAAIDGDSFVTLEVEGDIRGPRVN